MHLRANQSSSWLVKWLKGYIPNFIGELGAERKGLVWEEPIGFFRKDKWVFRTNEK